MIWIYYAFFEPEAKGNKRENEHSQGIELLRLALEERYGIHKEEMLESEIGKGDHGKPYLKAYPQIHYNISHCQGAAVLAIGDSAVGIDVERVRPYRERILKKVLSDGELRQMEAAGEDKRAELFFRFWTLKESYVKAVGCGITVPLQEIGFWIGDHGEITCERKGWQFRQWELAKGCIVSVCSAETEDFRTELSDKKKVTKNTKNYNKLTKCAQ